jgi:superfamily II DNA or RNA helicase
VGKPKVQKLKAILANDIFIPNSLVNKFPEEIEELKEACFGTNPAYKNYQMLLISKPKLAYAKNLPKPSETICLWKEENNGISFPRGLYSKIVSMGIPVDDITVDVVPTTPFVLNARLRDYQIEAIDKVTSSRFGVLQAPTGSGKTIMGLAIASTLQQKTIFIVHTKTLLKQTVEEVEKMFGFTPGIIGNGKFEIKDFTVATIQTLSNRQIPANTFGLAIFDECHHVPANSFLKIANSLKIKYMYGLSATPTRADGLTWALYATIGPTLHKIARNTLVQNNSIVPPKVIYVQTPYMPSKNFDAWDVAAHLNDVSECPIRNGFIVDYIKSVLDNNTSTKPVILTDRVNHVEYLAHVLAKYNPILYHAQLGTKQQRTALDAIKGSGGGFTIATYGAIGEGFDVPLWDTLFLATPFSSEARLIQVIGRVSRPAPGKTSSFVYDFVDIRDEVLSSRAEKRKRTYDQLK